MAIWEKFPVFVLKLIDLSIYWFHDQFVYILGPCAVNMAAVGMETKAMWLFMNEHMLMINRCWLSSNKQYSDECSPSR